MSEMLSLTEVAERVGVNKMTIYRWERQKKVPAPKRLVRTNKRLYTEDDVARLIDFRDAVIDPESQTTK
jgi:excisionase family DNA binding protein